MRKLTVREKTLIAILLVLVIISSYVMFFHTPITNEIEQAKSQIELDNKLIDELDSKIDEKTYMQNELDKVFENNQSPISMPDYDNIKSVMIELNRILSASNEYALSFESVDTSQTVVERNVSLPFTCSSYQVAYDILNQINNSNLRCIIDDVAINQDDDGTVSVNANIIFFEYCENPTETEETATP